MIYGYYEQPIVVQVDTAMLVVATATVAAI